MPFPMHQRAHLNSKPPARLRSLACSATTPTQLRMTERVILSAGETIIPVPTIPANGVGVASPTYRANLYRTCNVTSWGARI
jgi:hypothetical protein